jgi:hypothetical protein
MAISYPLTLPTTIGMSQITISANNVDVLTMSPFTYAQGQVLQYAGEMWTASVSIPPVKRDLAEAWVAFLLSLHGRVGTFLMGDPNAAAPRGTVTSLTVTGTTGQSSVTVAMTGTLLAGDYIQIGTASDATLHKVLVDKTNAGTLEIWPALRKDRTAVAATTLNTVGLWRLSSSVATWQIDQISSYGITFDCMEVV